MTHLVREDLERWRDQGRPEDRERITSHLAECEECTATFAEVVRTAPLETAATRLDPSKFVARGYAVRKPAKPVAQVVSWKAWAGALSAAALVVLVVLVGLPGSDDPTGPVTRGGITITAADATSVSWTSGITAPRFQVELVDARNVALYRFTTSDRTVAVPPDTRARLAPGEYTWKVTALDDEGRPISAATRTLAIGAAK